MKKSVRRRKNVKNNVFIIFAFVLAILVFSKSCFAETKLDVKEVTIQSNDTLWDIASNICQDNEKLNIQNVIIDIKDINGLDSSDIYVGQTIYIPKY